MNGPNQSNFTANPNDSDTKFEEPLEYDPHSIDDTEEAWLNEEEEEEDEEGNNNESNGKSGTSDGIEAREATSASTDSSSPRVRKQMYEGNQEKREESDYESDKEEVEEEQNDENEEQDDEEQDEDEDEDEIEDDDDDEETPKEQVKDEAEKEAAFDKELEEEEKRDGRSKQVTPVSGAQNLSGFWFPGSASGGELRLEKANNEGERQQQHDGRQVGGKRRSNKGAKHEGASRIERMRENKKEQKSNNKQIKVSRHKMKVEGTSKFAFYLGEAKAEANRPEFDTDELAESRANIRGTHDDNNFEDGNALIPLLEAQYMGKVRENERLVDLVPKLRILNQVEVCDIELFVLPSSSSSSYSSTPLSSKIDNDNRDHQHYIDYHNKNGKSIINSDRKLNSKAKFFSSSSSSSSANNEENKQDLEEEDKQEKQREQLPFIVSWIDRINGEATLEAKSELLMNCERKQNYTFKIRAIGCNGLHSNE